MTMPFFVLKRCIDNNFFIRESPARQNTAYAACQGSKKPGGITMSKTHSRMTKSLSVLLCTLMILSTVCFFNPFPALRANAFVDVNSTQSANDGYDLTFNVPESIYLKPGSANLEYFLINTVKSKGASAVSMAAASTDVSVSSPYATSMSLSYEILPTGKDVNGKAVNISGSLLTADGSVMPGATGTNSVSLNMNRNMTFSGYSDETQGTEAFIRWKLVYVADGETHTVYAYTTLYIPYLGQSGMSAHSRHNGTYANPENWTYSFITGGHSVTGGSASSKFVSTKDVNTAAKGAADAVFVAPLVKFTGGNVGTSRGDVAYPFANGGTVPWGSNFYTDAFTTVANGGVAIKSNTTSDDDYYPCNDSDLGTMRITVDTSRFPNYNQVPNLSAGWAQFRHDWDGGDNRLYWISGIEGATASGMSQGGLDGATITTAADTSNYEGNISLAKGLYVLNGTVTGGDHLMVFCYRNSYKPYVGNQSKVRTYAGVKLNVTAVDKAALRNSVFNAFNHGYSAVMANAEVEAALADASKVLSDVFAAQSEVNAAASKLNSAVENAKSAITAYFAKHEKSIVSDTYAFVPETIYLTPDTTSATEFRYYINNTVTFGNNSYTLTPDAVSNATSGKFYFKCADAVSLRVVVEGATATVNGTLKSGAADSSGALSSADISDSTTGGLAVELSDGYAEGTVTSGLLKSGLAQNGTKEIQWRFIYTLKDGNTRETVTAYTVVYAPYCQVTGSTANGEHTDPNPDIKISSISWWQGIHEATATRDCSSGGNKLDGKADYYPNASKFSPMLGIISMPEGNANGQEWFQTTANGIMNVKSFRYSHYYAKTDNAGCTVTTGYEGKVTVDTSRNKNLNTVPNLKVGLLVTRFEGVNSGEGYYPYYKILKYTGTSGGEGGYKSEASMGGWTGDTIESHKATSVKNPMDNQTYLVNPTIFSLGTLYSDGFNHALSSGTASEKIYYKAVVRARSDQEWAANVMYNAINITKVDKSGLRSKIADVIKLAQQFDWAFGNSSVASATSTLSGNLKTAYTVLGNPLATSAQIASAISNLNTNAETIKNAIVTRSNTTNYSGTAKANHYALVKTVNSAGAVSANPLKVAAVITDRAATATAPVDTENYFGSDTVVIGSNKFEGFTYQGYMTEKSFAGIGTNAPTSYYRTKPQETYLRIDETIKSEGRDNLYFYYTAPDEHLTVDLNGGVSSVENFNCDITASAGSTFTPAVPTKEGYTFVSWRLDGAGKLSGGTYTFGLGDGKLTAVWEPVPTQSAELIVDPDGGTMSSDLVYITNGAASASGNNGNGTLTYNITEGDGAQSLNISGHYKGFTYGEANATGERTQIIPVWVYLEAGKSYTISWTDDNAITEFFLFKNGDLKTRTHFNPGTAGAHSFTFTAGAGWTFASDDKDATGWYQLRLDQNMPVAAEGQPANEGDYNITGLSVKSNGDARLGYRQAAETAVFISEPVRDGYKFAGWSGFVNGSISRVDPDETNVNGGYLYTFKGKADTLVAQWTDAVYEIGFDNLFLATAWAEDKYTSASNDTVGFDKDNDIITYKNNKNADDQTDTEARRAESSYRITGLTPGKEYSLSFDFASNMTGSSANDCNTYVFAHFYDENGTQINIKNTAINYGDVVSGENTYVGKYIINYTDASGKAQTQITPSEWAGSNSRIFSGLQMYDVTVKDGYGHSDIIFTVPEGTESMDIAFGAQHAGQTVSFKNVQINEYDRVNPVTDYSRVQKSYGRDTSVFGELATAKKLGYDFNGWFTGKNGTGTRITASTSTAPYHTKFTVWSNWTEIEYTVTCDAAGGTLAGGTVNPTKYTINTEKITVAAAPTKQGYIFKGWKITKDTSVHSDNNWTEETVAAGREYTGRMFGDVKLTAVWEENAAAVKVTVREQNADGTYTDTVVINGKQLDGSVVDLANYIGAKTGFKAVVITNSGNAFALNNGRFTVVGGQNYDILIQRDREQYTFTVKYVMSDGSTAPAVVTKTLRFGQSDSVTSPVVTGYTPDRTVATVDAITENTEVTVTYTLDKHNVTVHYVYENGTKAADDKTLTVEYGKTYSIDSPKITGYTADQAIVSGKMGTGDITVTVKYTVNSHKLTIIYKYSENEHPETKQEYTFKYGEKYNYSVPTVEGFTASQSTVDGTMGDGDVTVTVTYTIITFTVTFKDWDGRLLKEENVKWNANATAPAAPSRDGYTFKGWDKAFSNIKANTEVTALYDINTYTLSFDANGGSAVSDIKQAYATAVTAPSTTRTGYTFVKWTGDDGSEVPSIMPARNINFTASWTANKYTIAFDANNGTGTTASVNATYDADAVLTANGFTRTGFSFAGWNTAKDGSGTAYADKATVRNLASENGAKATLYAQWTANSYTVTYRVDGNETAKQTYKYGETIKAIADPVKTGYTFMGWKETLPAAMPANDITVDAIFEVNTYTLTYTVDGAFYKSFEVKYGEAITATAEPAKTGYTFSGWNGVPSTMPANDVTVTGTFTVNSYKLTFMSDGKVYDEKTYDFGADITAPAAPTKTGYTFAGWDKEIPAAMPAENTVITAKWNVNKYTITFDTDGGTDIPAITQDYGTDVTAPVNPTKTGYTFAGWTPEVPSTIPAENITVKAQWSINSYTLTVKYVYEDGTEAENTHTESVVYGAAYSVASPEKEGFTPDTAAVSGTMPADNVTVTVTYKTNAYTATFDADNGSEAEIRSFKYGEKVVAPAAPAKAGYTFAGWTPEIPETMPAKDLSFKAVWTANGDTKVTVNYYTEKLDGSGYDIETVVAAGTTGSEFTAEIKDINGFTFKADGSVTSGTVAADGSLVLSVYYTRNSYTLSYTVDGKAHTSLIYKFGETVTPAAAPEKTGYTFSGWSGVPSTMPANDVEVSGTFTANTYYVAFDSNGGTGAVDDQQFSYGESKALTANAFERTGYTFAGWSTVANGVGGYNYTDGETVSNLCTANGAKYVLYAQWTANTYTVTFSKGAADAEGSMDAQTFTYDVAGRLTANAFVRNGYTFGGWTDGTNTYADGEEVKNFAAGGNVVLTAVWTANGDTTVTLVYMLEQPDGTFDEAEKIFSKGTTDAVYTVSDAEKKAFTGFTLDETASVLSGVVTADGALTLTLKYSRNSYSLTYTVDGAQYGEKKIYKFGEAVTAIEAPSKTGYTFSGWNGVPSAMPANDVTVTGTFTVNSYKLTFMSDGKVYDEKTYDFGADVTAPAEPMKTGYTFAGWDMEIPAKMPAENTVITAKWNVNKYTITFDTDGGTDIPAITQDYGTDVTVPAEPTKTGYKFAGWDKEIPATMPAENTVITAKWIPASDTSVKVEYYVESLTGEYVLKNTLVDSATTDAEYTAEIPAYDGFTFDAANSVITGIVKADSSLVLTVRYSRNTYTLSYTVDGKAHTSLIYKFGETVTPAAAPEKTGYTFSGWQGVPETMPANDVEASGTFTANTYYIAFDSNGGTGTMEKQRFTYDTAAKLAKNTFTKTDSVFVGWNTASDGSGYGYADEAEVGNLTSANDVTVTLYAQYKADKNNNGIPDDEETPWTVSYAAGEGGKLIGASSEAVLDGMKPVSVPEASANSGYAFRFWVDGDGVKVVPSAAVIRANTEFTAVFGVDANGNGTADEDEGKFTVTYDMNGAKLTELVLSGLTPEDVPSKDKANESKPDGKCFAYWTLNGEKVEPSAETVTADTTFVAVYTDDLNGDGIPDSEQKHYTVTYNGGEHGTLSGDTTVTVVENLAYSKAWEPAVTPDKGYMFKGWSNVPEKITDDVVITAIYGDDKNGNGKEDGTDEDPFCTVTFIDWNGEVIKTERILNGMSAAEAAPEGLTRDFDDDNHYTFDGWDKDITVITSDTNVTAQYTAAAHAYGEWTVTDKPTCTSFGTKERKCDCGKIETAQVEKAAHTPAEAVTENAVAATCETDGSHDEVVYCSVCGHEISRVNVVDKAAGHKAEKVAGKAATCTEPGLSDGEKCSVCGKTITEQTETPALGHDWGAWEETEKATCTENGEETRTCQREGCGETETRVTEKAAHTPAEAVTENAVAATCETDGSHDEVVYCSVCGHEISRVNVIDKAAGHKTEKVAGKAATCTEPGLSDGEKCSVCGKTIKEQTETPALGHDWGAWKETEKATCTENGEETRTCQREGCGETETRVTEKAAHTPAEAVTENAVAATCETDGSHDEVVYCSVCGHEISRVNVVDKAAGHKAEKVAGKAATCTEPGLSDGEKCSVCGKTITEQTEIPALGHDWGEWKVTVKPTYTSTGVAKRECARCGVTEEKELPPYVHGDDYLEIVAPAVIRAGSIADIKAVRMPEEVIESDAVWTTGDASVISVVGGKLYAVGEGTVTLTATTADGKLTAEKTVTVVEVDMDNARIIKFVNMRKMDYTVAGFYKIYNDGSIYWSRESECPFTVYTYTTFNYPDYIVYLDGKAVQADENGVYHIPAGTKNVIVTMAGAVDETPTQPDGDGSGSGTGTKVSFWEMILRFFRKLFSIFKKK